MHCCYVHGPSLSSGSQALATSRPASMLQQMITIWATACLLLPPANSPTRDVSIVQYW
jgi:hypothetical protein